jgi:hypothetical protein
LRLRGHGLLLKRDYNLVSSNLQDSNVIIDNSYQRNRLTDSLNPIRQLIRQAQEQDSANGKLLEFVECRKSHLHAAIKLPEQQAAKGLADFVVRYIKHVPDFIDAIRSMAQGAGIYKDVEPLLKIASDYFLSPPSIVDPHSQLEALLDEAYLAHRLLEEVNDRFKWHSACAYGYDRRQCDCPRIDRRTFCERIGSSGVIFRRIIIKRTRFCRHRYCRLRKDPPRPRLDRGIGTLALPG